MKKGIAAVFIIFAFIMISGLMAYVLKTESTRQIIDFNKEWVFSLDSEFSQSYPVDIPHTPKVEPLVVNNQWQGTMWYKKEFELAPGNNKKVFLRFEGIMHESDVWLNGIHLNHHMGGYLPIGIDLSKHLKEGKNTLTVKAINTDNPVIPPGKPLKDLDFNYYGGIYRDVELITKNDVYVSDPMLANKTGGGGILVHFSDISGESARCSVKIHAMNGSGQEKEVYAEVALTDGSGNSISQESPKVSVGPNRDNELSISLDIDRPKLWNTTSPHLYTLTTKLYSNGQKVDSLSQKVGVRKIELNKEGFFLNDKKMYLRGTNRHQEYPYVGYAISNEANYRDAIKIKRAGFD
ncbi:glycoside hydrolase family 2 protein, partial [Maribacter sp. 2304DJ31-5]|uniref:glycoside hydrolase family 2 protein n=1 Tax=Maribacter sp. 2304DJ31-5 TaxID=3386273 RepID=UPI0039BC4CB4